MLYAQIFQLGGKFTYVAVLPRETCLLELSLQNRLSNRRVLLFVFQYPK